MLWWEQNAWSQPWVGMNFLSMSYRTTKPDFSVQHGVWHRDASQSCFQNPLVDRPVDAIDVSSAYPFHGQHISTVSAVFSLKLLPSFEKRRKHWCTYTKAPWTLLFTHPLSAAFKVEIFSSRANHCCFAISLAVPILGDSKKISKQPQLTLGDSQMRSDSLMVLRAPCTWHRPDHPEVKNVFSSFLSCRALGTGSVVPRRWQSVFANPRFG